MNNQIELNYLNDPVGGRDVIEIVIGEETYYVNRYQEAHNEQPEKFRTVKPGITSGHVSKLPMGEWKRTCLLELIDHDN